MFRSSSWNVQNSELYVKVLCICWNFFSGSAAQRGLWPPRPRGFLITHDMPSR
jgi:hypothetical protein